MTAILKSPAAPLNWQAHALWQQLQPVLPGVSVEVLASVGSTNAAVLARARGGSGRRRSGDSAPTLGRRQGDLQPCLLVAEQQTAGRGRQGKTWKSSAGASLTFSLALPMAPSRGWSGLSLAVGCALADALDPAGSEPPALLLKWPNDLWLRDADATGGGRKLGGILIETLPMLEHRMVVVGIGLNVHPPAPLDSLPLDSGLACIDELDATATPPTVLARVALPLAQALRRFEIGGFLPFTEKFARRDLLAGRPLRTLGAAPLQGTGAGVDVQGVLQLRGANGQLHAVSSGEVSVRPC